MTFDIVRNVRRVRGVRNVRGGRRRFGGVIVPSGRRTARGARTGAFRRRCGRDASGTARTALSVSTSAGDVLFDRGLDGPAPFAGVGDVAFELRELRILDERTRRQIEQPRTDDAAATPEFGDRRKVQVVALVRRQRLARRRSAGCRSLRRTTASGRTRSRCGSS